MKAPISSFLLLCSGLVLTSCSSVYSLNSVAARASNPKSLQNDVSVDTASREINSVHKMAWVAYTVNFECEKHCRYTLDQRKKIAQEIAERSFAAIDREMRAKVSTALVDVSETVKESAFKQELKEDSYRSRVSRWLDKLGLSRTTEATATAQGLKALNPNEIGWSGEESLSLLGKRLGVDGVLVGHITVTAEEEDPKSDTMGKLVVKGPKVWLFSANKPKAVAIINLRPRWSLSKEDSSAPKYNWKGLDEVASGFSSRVAQALSE